MVDAAALAAVKKRYELLSPTLNERDRRLMVAAEALALGSRSVAAVSRLTGVDHKAIARGIKDRYCSGLDLLPGVRMGGVIR